MVTSNDVPLLSRFRRHGFGMAGLFVLLAFMVAWPGARGSEAVPQPDSMPDPLEGLNRRLWDVNTFALKYVIRPTGKGYRAIVPRPLRQGFSNVGQNIQYPKRLANYLLQGRWVDLRDDTYRFVVNCTFGLGGLIDIATRNGIPRNEADLGQTFAGWGWDPNFYLMLPLLGPTDDRDGVGRIGDSFASPLTYFSPYSYIPLGFTYNDLAEDADGVVRLIQSEQDPYYLLRFVWTFQRDFSPVDTDLRGGQDVPSLDTLGTLGFGIREVRFPERGRTRSIAGPLPGQKLAYTTWLQKERSPIVYLLPGLGSHRLSGSVLALAELLYGQGYSVVSISSVFNYEFIQQGAASALPGYAPNDVREIARTLAAIHQRLEQEHRPGFSGKAVAGFSMGGFHTLFLAASAVPEITFDRYVAVHTPVRLLHGIQQLDAFYRAPLEWPEAERAEKVRNTLRKAAALREQLSRGNPTNAPPLNAIESRYLIGAAFRLILRDAIFTTQLRTNQHVLQQPLNPRKREPVYREILNYSFEDYLGKFVGPYYRERGVDLNDPATLEPATDLRRHAEALRNNPNVRVIENANDILVEPADVEWLRGTLGTERLTIFERGGHLGNLAHPTVQKAILEAFAGMGTPAKTAASR